MTEEDLKAWIAEYLYNNAQQGGDFNDIAYAIFNKFEQEDYVQLDPVQSLPTQPHCSKAHLGADAISGYRDAQQDMLTANFKKVKP